MESILVCYANIEKRLLTLANVHRSLRKWDKVEEMARQMRGKAEVHYSKKHQAKRNSQELEKETKGPYLDTSDNILWIYFCLF
ncbi:hypothetical protein ASL14_14005 [Paenibacillus sp. IHB B 3084]|nr:hypothetical protein ASL14_14005 [Paenibacillus sp. IHB B 3084]